MAEEWDPREEGQEWHTAGLELGGWCRRICWCCRTPAFDLLLLLCTGMQLAQTSSTIEKHGPVCFHPALLLPPLCRKYLYGYVVSWAEDWANLGEGSLGAGSVCCTNICAGAEMGMEASSKGSRVCLFLLVTVTHDASLKYIWYWPNSVKLRWHSIEGFKTSFGYGSWEYLLLRPLKSG